MTEDEFGILFDKIMLSLAKDVDAGLLDEKPTERIAAIKALQQHESFKTRKDRNKKPGSALDAYRNQINGEPKQEAPTDGDALN